MTGETPPSDTDAAADAPQTKRSLRPLLLLLPYLKRHRGMVAFACAALLVSAAATLTLPIAIRRMIDVGFSNQDSSLINNYFAVLVAVGGVLALASACRFFAVNWLGERVAADLRSDVFAHLTRLGPAFYEKTHSGEVMSRLTADATQIKAAAGSTISQALRNTVILIGALIMMAVTSGKLSLLVVAAIPVIVLPLVAYGRSVKTLSRRAQDTLAEASAYAGESLSSIRTLQAFTHERAAQNQYRLGVERAFDAARARAKARAGLTAIAIFLVFASVVGVLWYGSRDVLAGEMSAGRLGQFVLYAVFAAGALGELSEVWGELAQASGAAGRLTELLHVPSAIEEPARPLPMPVPPHGEVAFRDVSFHYQDRDEGSALEHVTFAVAPGERVAIVGPSGAGKTTIFNLILRFFDPQSGVVTVDGAAVNRVSLADLRSRIALVPQDVALFDDTVAANIAYGSADAPRAKIEDAAKAALAHDFIMALPEGYDTKLGERGVTLSGGQRQRLAVARALLRDAPILLLDEATSALDAESETLLKRALDRVMEGRTTLVIAHRLATVLGADRILVLEEGRIVEEGDHQSLMKAGGLYARLASMQFDTRDAV